MQSRPAPPLSLSRAGQSEKYSNQGTPVAASQPNQGQHDSSDGGANDEENNTNRARGMMYQNVDMHYTKLSMPNPEYVLLGGIRKLNRMIPSLHTSLGTASLESDERRKAM